mgnify:FL=1
MALPESGALCWGREAPRALVAVPQRTANVKDRWKRKL